MPLKKKLEDRKKDDINVKAVKRAAARLDSVDLPQVNIQELALLTGISPASISNWTHLPDNPLPVAKRGARVDVGISGPNTGPRSAVCFDLREALPWIVDYLGARKKSEEKQRKDAAMAERYETENAIRSKTLLRVEQVKDVMLQVSAIFAAGMDSQPGRLSGVLANTNDPAKVREILFNDSRSVRNAVANAFAELAELPADYFSGSADSQDSE